MFYLMTHSTHFILRLYGVRHMIKDHSGCKRGNLLLPHGLLFPISSKGSFICIIPQICIIPDRITHTTAFVTPVLEHWLQREIAQWVHHGGSIRRPIALQNMWILLVLTCCFAGLVLWGGGEMGVEGDCYFITMI